MPMPPADMPAADAQVSGGADRATQALDEASLWCRWRDAEDRGAREQLISHYLEYARTVAAMHYKRRMHDEIEFAEYLQLASVGLVESVDRFDPAVGAQFKTFAARRMQGAILSGLERLTEKQQQIAVRQRLRRERLQAIKDDADAPGGAPHRPASARERSAHAESLFGYLAEVGVGLALSCLLEGTGMVDDTERAAPAPDLHYQPIELRQLQRHLHELVDRLSEQERTVIHHHYLQEQGFDELAVLLGVTKGRISQIHRKALATLRAELGARRRCDVAW